MISTFILLMVTVFADPIPVNKKNDVAEKNKSNTRHDHSSSNSGK